MTLISVMETAAVDVFLKRDDQGEKEANRPIDDMGRQRALKVGNVIVYSRRTRG